MNRWAIVTAISPLRIKLDGGTAALPLTPPSLVDPASLSVGDFVRVEQAHRKVVIIGRSKGVSIPSGNIEMTARATAPGGWLLCQGQTVSRTTYAALFTAISTTYGTGNGSTTFNVPDFRGRTPVGLDSSQTEFDTLGEAFGAKTHTLVSAELASTVERRFVDSSAFETGATNSPLVASSGTRHKYSSAGVAADPHNNVQPSRVVNFIIKT